MKRWKAVFCGTVMFGSFALSACGVLAAGIEDGVAITPQEAVESTMESLKALDLDRFNACTDNYVETYYNWIGVPVETEYRVFNELQQPGVKVGKWKEKYEFNYKISQKMMENLEWKIGEIEEAGDLAYITMEISNLNMSDIMGEYEIHLWETMLAGDGTGIVRMVRELSNITEEEGGLLTLIESCGKEDICTLPVTATAYRENGAWKVHLDEEFINAFMGNINAEEYSEEIRQRIEELEERQDEKLDEWADEFEALFY